MLDFDRLRPDFQFIKSMWMNNHTFSDCAIKLWHPKEMGGLSPFWIEPETLSWFFEVHVLSFLGFLGRRGGGSG